MRVGQTPHRAMDFIVAEKMGWIDIDRETRSLFNGEWGYHSKWGAYDKSLPTAICRCVLRVMGVEEF